MDYPYPFRELKKRAEISLSNASIYRYVKFGLIDCEMNGGNYFFSDKSVKQLILITKLRNYNLTDAEIRDIFLNVPIKEIETLTRKSPDEFFAALSDKYNISLR